jgi:DNA-binding SARP family transcriptional activator/TolB-like protein
VIFIHVLGAPVIRRPEGPITGRAAHRRRLGLVAILAAARGRPVGRERIIGLLWPENTADAARHTLSEALYVLRKDLGEESFVVVGDEVGLDPAAVRSDLDDFEQAMADGRWEDAVKAYGGPFLDGFFVADAPEFERWAEGERDRHARAYGRALEELATAAEADGTLQRAAEWWRRLLAHDAFSSRVALRLVRVLERAGERAAALRAAEAHVLLLREELGVGPDAELVELMEDLRREPPAPPPRPARPAAPVTDVSGDDEAPPAPGAVVGTDGAAAGAAVERAGEVAAAAPPRRRRRLGVRAAAAAGAAAAVVVLAVLAATRGQGPSPAPEFDPRRIAVLYLDDDSPGGELQYLANGLTEMLIHELSQVEALDVVSRNGVKPYRQGTIPFDSMVADLRVGSVVEGSVTRSADSVRVVVQLIDANTQSHLESREIVRPLGDLLALQRAVSQEVSGFLRQQLGAQVRLRQTERETRSTRALDQVLRGEQAYADAKELRNSRDSLDTASALRMLADADSLLARAEAADPRWARPVVARGWVAVAEAAWSEGMRQMTALDSAEARAGRVLARDPAHARALEVRGRARFMRGLAPDGEPSDLDGAENDLRAAVAAEPSLASAWGTLSLVLLTRGQFQNGDLAARRALEQDAWLEEADMLLNQYFHTALLLGDYRTADEACGQGRRRFPGDARFVQCRLLLLREDPSRAADATLAWRLVDELAVLDPPARAAAAGRVYDPIYRRMVAASVSARAGDTARARAELTRARLAAAPDPDARVSLLYDEAALLLLLGDRRGARERLDVYLAQRSWGREFAARDPLLRDLLSGSGASSR